MMRRRLVQDSGGSPLDCDRTGNDRYKGDDTSIRRHCRHHLVLWCLAFVTLALLALAAINVRQNPAKLVIISVSALRWDYLNKIPSKDAPFLTEFLKKGSRVEWLDAGFLGGGVSMSTSILTGLYPDQHGVLGEHFMDDEHGEMMLEGSGVTPNSIHWWSGSARPIWYQAAEQWRDVAIYNMYGACVPFDGYEPRFCRPRTQSHTTSTSLKHIDPEYEDKLGEDLDDALIKLQDKHFHVAVVHTDSIRHAAEKYGADSQHVLAALKTLDYQLKRLDSVTASAIGPFNVVIVSDGGLTDTKNMREISLDEHLPADVPHSATGNGAVSFVYTAEKSAAAIQQKLNAVAGLKAYIQQQIPVQFRLKHPHRAPTVLVVAETDYYIENSKPLATAAAGGYDNTNSQLASMRGVLMARGPNFKSGVIVPSINAVDVHALLCHILWLSNTGEGKTEKLLPMLV